jgi:hypothetical protein
VCRVGKQAGKGNQEKTTALEHEPPDERVYSAPQRALRVNRV